MESDLKIPQIGQTCPALSNENYDYHLSGDCNIYCICVLNDKPCLGRRIEDPDDASSQFFSRGKCMISQNGLKKCPAYGLSKDTLSTILREKMENTLNEKLKSFNK